VKNHVLNHSLNHSLSHSPSLFDVPGTEAFALVWNYCLLMLFSFKWLNDAFECGDVKNFALTETETEKY